MATLTVYPDSGNPGTTSVARRVFRSGVSENFATITAGAGTGVITILGISLRATSSANVYQENYRTVCHFDTSALTSGASISSAVFSLYGFTPSPKTDDAGKTPNLALLASTVVSNNTVADADYQSHGTTEFATRYTYAAWTGAGYNDFTLNASGLSAISKTGTSKFFVMNGQYDLDGVDPSLGGNQEFSVNAYDADTAGTTNDPKLVITYTLLGTDNMFQGANF